MSNRTCAYCGHPRCNCTYRVGRAGTSSVTGENISAQTNLNEMLKQLQIYVADGRGEIPTTWKFSFTRLKED